MTDDRAAHLAEAEATLTEALSLAPEHAYAHLRLGEVQINTNRAAQGIAECEQALALDRNLGTAHEQIGLAKIFTGRAEQAEAHIDEALRLSPRDTHLEVNAALVGFQDDLRFASRSPSFERCSH
jgi:Flp pilus assembly protein TadD